MSSTVALCLLFGRRDFWWSLRCSTGSPVAAAWMDSVALVRVLFIRYVLRRLRLRRRVRRSKKKLRAPLEASECITRLQYVSLVCWDALFVECITSRSRLCGRDYTKSAFLAKRIICALALCMGGLVLLFLVLLIEILFRAGHLFLVAFRSAGGGSGFRHTDEVHHCAAATYMVCQECLRMLQAYSFRHTALVRCCSLMIQAITYGVADVIVRRRDVANCASAARAFQEWRGFDSLWLWLCIFTALDVTLLVALLVDVQQ